jgi:hypothetical protein
MCLFNKFGNESNSSPPSTSSMTCSGKTSSTAPRPPIVVDFVAYMATATNAIERGNEFNRKQKALDSRIAEYKKNQMSGVEDANEKAAIDEATDKQRKLLAELIQKSCARGFEEMLEILVESTTNHHLWLDATAIAADFCNGFVQTLKEASDAGGMEVIAVSIMMQTSLFFNSLFIDDTLKCFLVQTKCTEISICAQKTTFIKFMTDFVKGLIEEQTAGTAVHFAEGELVQISMLMDRT